MPVKKFIIKFLLFMAPLALLLGGIELALHNVPNAYALKRQYLEASTGNIQTLILGNSHTYYGINPAYLTDTAFNLAYVSQSVFYDRALTLKYFHSMKQLKRVIIPVSYSTLYYQLSDTKEAWRDYYYWHYWNIKYDELPRFSIKKYSLMALYTPTESISLIARHFSGNLKIETQPNGAGWMDTSATATKDINDITGLERARRHDREVDFKNPHLQHVLAQNLDYLNSLIQQLKSKNIDVVFVTTPVMDTYSKHCRADILQNTDRILKNLCSKYNCRYFNYFTDPRFTIEDFADNDHVNFIGAEKFTRILSTDIAKAAPASN